MYVKRLSIAEFVATADHIWEQVEELFPATFGSWPSPGEVTSWRNSYPALAKVLRQLPAACQEWVIFLEFGMPSSSTRADVLIVGLTRNGQRAAVVVELKQWSANAVSITDGGVRLGTQNHLHPCDQALAYREYLQGLHVAFADPTAIVRSCCLMHGSTANSCRKLISPPFDKLVEVSPLFAADDAERMCTWLAGILQGRPDSSFIDELGNDQPRVSKSLAATAARAIREEPAWILLDEQRLAFNTVMDIVKRSDGEKHVILVTGGPGSGKSVVAMQIFGELHRRRTQAVHITNSSSFTTVMQSLVTKRNTKWGSAAVKGLFRLSHTWVRKKDKFQVAVCDEAHRFRSKTTLYKQGLVSNRRQAEEILENVDILIAFIDERQRLRRGEDGTLDYFRSCANAAGVRPENVHGPIQLGAQFRSAGNYEFVAALDRTLYGGAARGFTHARFQCAVLPTVEDVEKALRDHINAGYSARLVAGFCWPWSNPKPSGELENDVKLRTWVRAWNRKAIGSYPADRHPYALWANPRSEQLDEVGCIYSAQGFEFEYVGVIWGKDLVWKDNRWIAQPAESFDREINPKRGQGIDGAEVEMLLKNAYRVLCTRALRGCFIYCQDESTRAFLQKALGPRGVSAR